MAEGVSNRPLPLSIRGAAAGPSADAVSLVDDLLQHATRALFDSYGVGLVPEASPVSKTLSLVHLISVIGFSSDLLSGSLLLATPNSVVEHTLPAPGASLPDWSGELSNQLIGRFKNQLLDYQIAINISLPVVIAGGRFALPAKTRPLTRHFSFASEWGSLFVRIEAEVGPGFLLVRRAEDKQSMGEGDVVVF